jgi:protease I
MMAERPLAGRRVAVLSTLGFERVELVAVRDALVDAGAEVRVVAPRGPAIRAFEFPEWADEVQVDLTLDEARPDGFDALYVPGGIINPDLLRADARAVAFARAFLETDRPVASMCHGPWVLISAGGVRGRRVADPQGRPGERGRGLRGRRANGRGRQPGHGAAPGRHPGAEPRPPAALRRGRRRRRAGGRVSGAPPHYPTDLTDAQWALVEPFLPMARGRGRPRSRDRRRILDAIFYALRTGCAWRLLPRGFGPWQTAYHYFRTWARDGTWHRVHEALRRAVRVAAGRPPDPSVGIADSQTVRTTERGDPAVTTGASARAGASATCWWTAWAF